MEHNISLITALIAAFSFALVLGYAAERFKIPALVGYWLAGILLGPARPDSLRMWGGHRSCPK